VPTKKKSTRIKKRTRFEVYEGANLRWYYRLKASNGKIILGCSETDGFPTKAKAYRAMNQMIDNIHKAELSLVLLLEEEVDVRLSTRMSNQICKVIRETLLVLNIAFFMSVCTGIPLTTYVKAIKIAQKGA
jgi:uncharacterized protein YegP (UPF0339 family)